MRDSSLHAPSHPTPPIIYDPATASLHAPIFIPFHHSPAPSLPRRRPIGRYRHETHRRNGWDTVVVAHQHRPHSDGARDHHPRAARRRRRRPAAEGALLPAQLPRGGGGGARHRAGPRGRRPRRAAGQAAPPLLPRLLRQGLRRIGAAGLDAGQHGGEGRRPEPVAGRVRRGGHRQGRAGGRVPRRRLLRRRPRARRQGHRLLPVWPGPVGRPAGAARRRGVARVGGARQHPVAVGQLHRPRGELRKQGTRRQGPRHPLRRARTIGVGHCNAFAARLGGGAPNSNSTTASDPTLNAAYAAQLRASCGPSALSTVAAVPMDPGSPARFDAHYYVNLKLGRGLFASDAALLTDRRAAGMVHALTRGQGYFLQDFRNAVRKMGRVGVLAGGAGQGEVRRNCRAVNFSK